MKKERKKQPPETELPAKAPAACSNNNNERPNRPTTAAGASEIELTAKTSAAFSSKNRKGPQDSPVWFVCLH